jgi:hypothetical protein
MALSASLAIDIVSQAALKAFNAAIAPLKAFSTDFSADAVQVGKKILFTWTPAGATVNDYNAQNGYVTEAPTQLPKELSIDKNKYVGFEYTDDQLATLSMMKLDDIGKQYGAALAEAVIADIWSLITAANYGAAAYDADPADFDSDDVLDIGKVCTDAKWPKAGRNMILNPDCYVALCKDPAVKTASAFGGTEAIRQGVIPALGTFENIFESTVIPANAENLLGFAVNTEAIGVAFRAIQPDATAQMVMNYQVFSNESGMTIAFKEWYDTKFKTTRRVLEVNYGKCVGNPDGIKRIVGQSGQGVI